MTRTFSLTIALAANPRIQGKGLFWHLPEANKTGGEEDRHVRVLTLIKSAA